MFSNQKIKTDCICFHPEHPKQFNPDQYIYKKRTIHKTIKINKYSLVYIVLMCFYFFPQFYLIVDSGLCLLTQIFWHKPLLFSSFIQSTLEGNLLLWEKEASAIVFQLAWWTTKWKVKKKKTKTKEKREEKKNTHYTPLVLLLIIHSVSIYISLGTKKMHSSTVQVLYFWNAGKNRQYCAFSHVLLCSLKAR